MEFIFNPRKEIPKATSARLMRWALSLSAFDYEIEYVKGENIPYVDALSRLDFDAASDADDVLVGEEEEGTFVHWTETDIASLEEMKLETSRERLLIDILRRVETNKWNACSVAENPFKAVRQSLTVENGVLCNGGTVVSPTSLRKKILSSVHDDVHCGTAATRNRLRLEAWWPDYCSDVETYVNKCPKCAEIKPSSKGTTHTWPVEDPHIHMDHAFILPIGLLLIVVDSFSGWPEVFRVADWSAKTVKAILCNIFCRNGVPKTVVSDNAAEFGDLELCK